MAWTDEAREAAAAARKAKAKHPAKGKVSIAKRTVSVKMFVPGAGMVMGMRAPSIGRNLKPATSVAARRAALTGKK